MSLNRAQFVFRERCGCPRSVIEATTEVDTVEAAWADLELTPRQEIAMRRRGVTAVRVPHAEYVATYSPMMRADYTCPHTTA